MAGSMAMRSIAIGHGVDAQGGFRDRQIRIEGGIMAALVPATEAVEDVVAIPALANAHDHARPLRTSSIGGFGKRSKSGSTGWPSWCRWTPISPRLHRSRGRLSVGRAR